MMAVMAVMAAAHRGLGRDRFGAIRRRFRIRRRLISLARRRLCGRR